MNEPILDLFVFVVMYLLCQYKYLEYNTGLLTQKMYHSKVSQGVDQNDMAYFCIALVCWDI